ncbi:MAG: sigma-54-dependent Fis family transcriptional regulator [Nitrospirota bacterium]|nr:sigma-54-dependent Fis family transcriptional regulator [Nitrospirota bacterium]
MNHAHIVIVDDESAVRETLRDFLVEEGYQVTAVADGQAAVQAVKSEPTQVVLTDLRLQGMDGLEILERVMQVNAQISCIVMTGFGTIEQAVKAMKAGAYDFITKPIQFDVVSLAIRKALEFQQLRQENFLLRKAVREKYRSQSMVGTSEPMRELHDFIDKVADSDSTVLIQGESGTGKELVARMLHYNSLRRDRPFVPINCGAIPENLLESELFGHEKGAFSGAIATRMGRFELAHGGTLFLDEVGEMSPPLQVKLLRALQERAFERVGGSKTVRVDVRIISATNQDLELAVQEKRFRQDLYYRLNVIPVMMPPLRTRQTDVPLLINHFLRQFNEAKGTSVRDMDGAAVDALSQYGWPGNIRELENLIERLVILKRTGTLTVADLPEKIRAARPVPSSARPVEGPVDFNGSGVDLVKELEQYENRLILEALRQTNGVTSKAAQLLRLNRTTLVEKLKRKGLEAKVSGVPVPERGSLASSYSSTD